MQRHQEKAGEETLELVLPDRAESRVSLRFKPLAGIKPFREVGQV